MNKKAAGDLKVIDASDLIVGRLASIIAKRLLLGERITVVNAEKAVFSGRKYAKLSEMKKFLEIVGRGNPIYGPKHPRRPDTILRRVIRGMLPMEKPRGRQAFKALRVHVGSPTELVSSPVEGLSAASATRLHCPYVSLGEIAKEIGWKELTSSAR